MLFMRKSRNFRQVSLTKKAPTFFFFVFSPQLIKVILQKSSGQFQRNLPFFKVPEGVQHFPRGVQLFPGGVQLLIPYRNPYNLWFFREGPDPLSPFWIPTCIYDFYFFFVKQRYCILTYKLLLIFLLCTHPCFKINCSFKKSCVLML